jgi:hypothetical protein
MDLSAFYVADGHGRAAYEPAMMVTLLLYAYARDAIVTGDRPGPARRTWPIA